MNIKPVIGIIASKGARVLNGPAYKFIRSHLGAFENHQILTTQGTYDDLFCGTTNNLQIEHLRPGYSGGVVELATKVINQNCQTVLFFSDADDPQANSYENQMLVRQSIVHNIELLQNIWGATIWAENNHKCIGLPFEQQTVALISHDAKKPDMLAFVGQNVEVLRRFGKIICTGTTGSNIKKTFPTLTQKVFPFKSGPAGGDCQITNEIIEGRCQHVVFFIDPGNPHPHAADIQLFIRVCQQFKDVNVNFLVTETSARRWIKTVQSELAALPKN